MKKEPSKELLGQRVASGETDDQYQEPQAAPRKKGEAKHALGHHEVIRADLKTSGSQILPQLKQNP